MRSKRYPPRDVRRKKNPAVQIASSAGFCFGVRRAIELAEGTAGKKEKIYTLGPLIHNPQEVRRLAKRGITPVENPSRVRNATLLLRTHGIPSALRKRLSSRQLTLVDATCPFVKRAQDFVGELSRTGHQVIIVGDGTHPEVVGLVSYGKGKCRVVESVKDLEGIPLADRVGVVSQTTQTPENFDEVIRHLKKRRPDVKIYNTICRATMDRQTEARRLARIVDAMVVVGGKNSGNTRRLAEISAKYTATHLIETADELKPAWFRGALRVGITAGASTPDWIIENVKNKVQYILDHVLLRGKSAGSQKTRAAGRAF